jgi:hypothetical protein
LIFRVIMVADIVPLKPVQKQFHAWKEWPQRMKDITGGQPVIFNSSYQQASQYQFHTGQIAYSLNYYKGRRNQFNFISVDKFIIGNPAWFFDSYNLKDFTDTIQTPAGTFGYRYDSAYISFPGMEFITEQKSYRVNEGQPLRLKGKMGMYYNYGMFIGNTKMDMKDTIRIAVFDKKGWVKDIITTTRLKDVNRNLTFSIAIDPALSPGKYELLFAINCGFYPPTANSKKIHLSIE